MRKRSFSEESSGCLIDFSICNDSAELKRFVPIGATVSISVAAVLIKDLAHYIARFYVYHNLNEIISRLKHEHKNSLIFNSALIFSGVLMILFSVIKRHQEPLKIEDHMLYFKKKSWCAKDITLVKKCYSGKTKFYSGKKCIADYYTDDYLTVFMWAETYGVKTEERSLNDFGMGQRAAFVLLLAIAAIILSVRFLA